MIHLITITTIPFTQKQKQKITIVKHLDNVTLLNNYLLNTYFIYIKKNLLKKRLIESLY